MVSKSLRKVRRMQKQGREIHDQDKIIDVIEELYTDSEQSNTIHTDPIDVSDKTLKARMTKVSKCLSERQLSTAWTKAKMVIIFKNKFRKTSRTTDRSVYYQTSKHAHENTNENARDDTRRKPATRSSWTQEQILNDRPNPCRKSTEGQVQRI